MGRYGGIDGQRGCVCSALSSHFSIAGRLFVEFRYADEDSLDQNHFFLVFTDYFRSIYRPQLIYILLLVFCR